MTGFADAAALWGAVAAADAAMVDADWREAFLGHPRIGAKQVRDKWAAGEQSGAAGASQAVLDELVALNDAYFARRPTP